MNPKVDIDGQKEEKVEPGELLENCWFFGNTKTRSMLRSLSDPCTSSNYIQEKKSYEETYESINKLHGNEELSRRNLIRQSSVETKDQNPRTKGSNRQRSKSKKKTSSNDLLRAPSLPTRFEDEDIEFSMGKLIRQASLKNSDTLPPRTHAAKGLTRSSSISMHKTTRKAELQSNKLDEVRPLKNQLKTQKSFNDLEYEELQGFKDLGFDFDEKELNPNVISIIPGLQEKKKTKEEEEEEENTSSMRRRPYLSEAWPEQSSTPPVPKWGRKTSNDDMKMQIKFWARAVASNVRQEC
ncbi:hypothetical protein ACJIZ3_011098 [Penstemon smallii]|uniref:Uncharacterized protein n=1 Tax=Penstemon smallii TaxID=265156 RepID=A0ABD3UI58_9LAMI